MAPGSIRKALDAVKDQTSIGLAKVGKGSSIASELDVAIVKVTRHDEFPAEERHLREILSLTHYSRARVSSCVSTLSRRLGKTHSWAVALKALILVHRLLKEGDPAYEQEIFFATKRGTRMLNMSDFRDKSRSDAWDFSAFVRTYAAYLDDRLEYRMQGTKRGKSSLMRRSRDEVELDTEATIGDDYTWEEREKEREREREGAARSALVLRGTPIRELKTERLFLRVQHLQQLMERFLACRPTGVAKSNRIIGAALFVLVKESFQLYFDVQEIIGVFVERFSELDISECVRVHNVFYRLSKQLDELEAFYTWCKTNLMILRPSEFPDVELIQTRKLQLMDDYIHQKHAVRPEEQNSFKNNNSISIEYHKKDKENDMNDIKTLPAPEPQPQPQPQPEPEPEPERQPEPEPEPEEKHENNLQLVVQEVDFLNLNDDTLTTEEHGDKLALALFDGNLNTDTAPKWEPFDSSSSDWETTLVQTASGLTAQKPTLGGGLDMMTLNGMYTAPIQATNIATTQNFLGNGSASSVAIRPPVSQGPQMLALPAPPVTGMMVPPNADPFAASLTVAAPCYVQMSELEMKQRLLKEEQMAWQQYARDGMHGQAGLARLHQQQQQQQQQYPYGPTGGYNRMY